MDDRPWRPWINGRIGLIAAAAGIVTLVCLWGGIFPLKQLATGWRLNTPRSAVLSSLPSLPGEMAETACPPPPPRRLKVELVDIMGQTVHLRLTNESTQHASVRVSGVSYGDRQQKETDLLSISVPAGTADDARFPIPHEAIGRRRSITGGTVHLVVQAQFDDGYDETSPSTPLYVSQARGKTRLSETPDIFGEDAVPGAEKAKQRALLRAEAALPPAHKARQRALEDAPDVQLALSSPTLSAPDDPARDTLPGALENGEEDTVIGHQLVPTSVCFKIVTEFTDSGAGEDTWTTSTPYARKAIGNKVRIWHPGRGEVEYNLATSGSGKGCLWDNFYQNHNYFYVIHAEGRVQGHTIAAGDEWGPVASMSGIFGTSASSHPKLTIDPANDPSNANYNRRGFNMYMAAARAMKVHDGIGSGSVHLLWRNFGNLSFYSWSDKKIRIVGDAYLNKFVISHEVGHWIMDSMGLGGDEVSYSYNYSNPDNNCTLSGTHSLESQEYQSTALSEGFASFYGADAFNSHNETNCFGLYGTNCENGSREMQDHCPPSTSWPGRGNEMDWTRAFWDLHTENPKPSMDDIVRWMRDSHYLGLPWSLGNVHHSLTQEAFLETNFGYQWSSVSDFNGTCYASECDFP